MDNITLDLQVRLMSRVTPAEDNSLVTDLLVTDYGVRGSSDFDFED